MPRCPPPKAEPVLFSPSLARQPSSPSSSSSYFPPASEAKQNAVLTKNNNLQQIQTMDKPPARARATRILPEEDGIIRRSLRHLSIAAVCGPRRLSDGAAAFPAVKAVPPKRLPSGAGAHGGLGGGLHTLIPPAQKQRGPSPSGCFWRERRRCLLDASVVFSPQRGGQPGCVLTAPLLARLLPHVSVLASSMGRGHRGASLALPPLRWGSHH